MIVEPCYLCGTVTVNTVECPELNVEYFMCSYCYCQDLISLRTKGMPYIPERTKEADPIKH